MDFNFKDMMKQALQLKKQLKNHEKEMAKKIFEGEAGAGMVVVRINGRSEVLSVFIDPNSAPTNDLKMLQDLVKSATNAALQKVQSEVKGLLSSSMGGGGGLGGMFGGG